MEDEGNPSSMSGTSILELVVDMCASEGRIIQNQVKRRLSISVSYTWISTSIQ